jgi:hypothetical protein
VSAGGRKKKARVSPIYTVALIWLVYSVFAPPYGVGRIAAAVVLSVAGFAIVSAFVKKKYPDEYVEEKKKPEPEPEKKETSHGEVVDGIIAEGRTAQKELGRLYASISNVEVKKKIRDIMEVSDKIVQDAIDDPSDVPQIKKFLDYYLPTTIKLLNAYDRMGAQGIDGENISGTMSSIEQMLDTAIEAYKKLLDSLFANQAMDIETDIDVMNTLLKREGLAGDGGAGFRQ